MKYLLVLAVILIQFQIAWLHMDIRRTQTSLKQAHSLIAELRFHTKQSCLAIPDDAICVDKTVFFKLPGGSHRKEIRRVCAWKSPVEQKWKEDE